MYRGLLLCCTVVALAQIPPQEDPVRAAINASQTAHNQGRFDEAAVKRAQARSLLDQVPGNSPQFGNFVERVAFLYQTTGLSAQALAIVQQGLTRAALPASQLQLLQRIADFYQQDQNLLQAAVYREKAIAAMEESLTKPAALNQQISISRISGGGSFSRLGSGDSRIGAYEQLANLYQQLGRTDAVAGVVKRIALISKDSPGALGSFYEQHGQLDEATALYKKETNQTDPSLRAEGFRSLANVYEREQRFADAADAYRQTLAALNLSGGPAAQMQAVSIQSSLARALNQAGQREAADQVYDRLIAETTGASDGMDLQALTNFANYLGETKRDAQAQSLLSDYLTNHPGLEPMQQSNVLMQLSYIARRSGDATRAEEYMAAGREKQQASQFAPPPQELISKTLQSAQKALQGGNLDEAFALSSEAMDAAPNSTDRDQIAWQIPNIASQFLNKKKPAKAEQLYQRLFGTVESWAVENPQPLIQVLQNYSQFLLQQEDRWKEAPATIKRYREAVISAHGATSGGLEAVLRATTQFEIMHGTPQGATAAAQDLVALNESLSGNTSEPYLRASTELAQQYQSHGDLGRAIPIYLQNVAIADLVYPSADHRRGQVRIAAAMILAQQRQFDEAERLATEAVAIGKGVVFQQELEQIRKMRTAPIPKAASGNNPWFQKSKPQN